MPTISLSFSVNTIIVVLAALFAAGIAWRFYRTTVPPVPRTTRLLLTILRGVALFLLLALLFEPLLSLLSTSTQQPVLAVLVDNSKSMTITDGLGSRAHQLKAMLSENDVKALVPGGEVRWYLFGSKPREIPALIPDSLTLDEDATDITGALRAIARERERQNVGAILLITDGNYNLGQSPLYQTEVLSTPIYTVGIGDTTEQRDVLVTKLVTNELVYNETEVPVDITIKSSGYTSEKIEVILSEGAKELSRASVTLQEGTREYAVRLSYIPEGEGVKKYSVRITHLPGEITTANNQRTFLARVLKSRLQILILAGAPSPDLAIAKQTLREDKNLHVRSLTQKSPTAFYEQENLSTLLDSADCVVMIGFPSASTSEATVELVRAALARRPLPILFINGRSVDERKLAAFGPLLPFSSSGTALNEQLVFPEPVAAQRNHPILATNTDEGVESWRRLPPIFKMQTTYRAKPEATVLASVRINTTVTSEPLIAIRNVNRQKSLALTGYGLWRWRLMAQGNAQTEKLLSTFLSNGIRWLTTREDARPVKVTPAKPAFAQGEPIEFLGQVYDASAHAVENAQVKVTASHEGGEFEMTLRPIGNGRYEGTLEGLNKGDYTFRAVATHEGQPLGEDRGRFSVGELNLEFQDTRMNAELLRQLAARSGGAFFLSSDVAQLRSKLGALPTFTQREVKHARERELWNWTYTFVLIVLLFGVEWFVRKRNGML